MTWNTLKRFAQVAEVSVACLYHSPAELDALSHVKDLCEECVAFPAHGKWALSPLVKSLGSSWPYKAHRFYNAQMGGYVRRMWARHRFDVIHAQNFYTTPYITGSEPCLKVHYKENIEGNLLLRLSQASSNPLVKCAAWLEGIRTRHFEARACRKFDQILTISPIDREHLLRLNPALPVQHQRPGVDLEIYPFLEEIPGPPRVVFTGTMSYYPNADGVRDFLRTSWPLIKFKVPEAECHIVGANPPRTIQRLHGKDDVYIPGRVADIAEYLEKATVYIVPLRIGGGIRLKILEAMATGRAMVSTSIGCEGLDVHHQEHLLVQNDPIRFADAVVQLLKDREQREYLRRNARTRVEDLYDWDQVIKHQWQQYCSLSDRLPSLSRV